MSTITIKTRTLRVNKVLARK